MIASATQPKTFQQVMHSHTLLREIFPEAAFS